ncbi:hypothetical protein FJTKL_14082 [Diaporthe vaccinii]|uniref:Uncharacterized protein n=1 Tax=Diaporthe vaccinii TaxID=105482 RepID=A0ABR4E956_9PEZI
MDGLNDFRTVRVAEVLSDFQSIQYFIAAAPVDPPNMNDYYTEGWAALRQCNLDGQRILNCGADTSVPETSGGPDEQAKAELKQVLLDAFARRHEAQKIYLRQAAAQRWIEYRELVLKAHSGNQSQLRRCDQQLRAVCFPAQTASLLLIETEADETLSQELQIITDEAIYAELQSSDINSE